MFAFMEEPLQIYALISLGIMYITSYILGRKRTTYGR